MVNKGCQENFLLPAYHSGHTPAGGVSPNHGPPPPGAAPPNPGRPRPPGTPPGPIATRSPCPRPGATTEQGFQPPLHLGRVVLADGGVGDHGDPFLQRRPETGAALRRIEPA